MTHALVLALLLGETLRPGVAVKDEGTLKGRAETVNCTGAGVTCSVAGGVWTLNGSGGAGGSPGGSGAEVQFRSGASTFGAVANVTSDGTSLILAPVTTAPSAPSSGLKPFAHSPVTTSAPSFTASIDAASGISVGEFPYIGGGHAFWGCAVPGGASLATMKEYGVFTLSSQGTAAGAAWASTSLATRTPRTQFNSAAAINSVAGMRYSLGNGFIWRGNAAGAGGFHFWSSWITNTPQTGMRVMVGMVVNALGTGDPNALANSVYFGCNAADTNLSICSNDNVSTATCNTLGANFPCADAAAFYGAHLWAAPNASSIGYALERYDTGQTASGSIASDLPQNTAALIPHTVISSGTNSAAVQVQIPAVCYWANP